MQFAAYEVPACKAKEAFEHGLVIYPMEGTFIEVTLAEYHIDALVDKVNQA